MYDFILCLKSKQIMYRKEAFSVEFIIAILGSVLFIEDCIYKKDLP